MDKISEVSSTSKDSSTLENQVALPLEKTMHFNFGPMKIMTQLNMHRINKLGDYWSQYKEGISIAQFTQLMLDKLQTFDDEQKYELIYGCFKLFNEVDINGDGSMEWTEFMQYIIDAVSDNTIKSDEEKSKSVIEQI